MQKSFFIFNCKLFLLEKNLFINFTEDSNFFGHYRYWENLFKLHIFSNLFITLLNIYNLITEQKKTINNSTGTLIS